ncbi:DUF2339 domain-containing protein [Agrobacterium sp. RAC06]|uniref:DUF2339 domain-containing protein n=1 Tax=Agrobacterium sp. RAC06 TaxID=1842536 RepID=UPI00083E6A3E|nr:DUF2339 domain-containing protein [Agrobacterium sp. RAC06]AOG12354.1 hypothetical protein BSY240_1287 [Agrobacterium sp. RAC06]
MFELLPLILIGVLFVINRGAAKRIDRLERELGEVRERLLKVSGATATPSAIQVGPEEPVEIVLPETSAETLVAEAAALDGAPYQSAPASLPEENAAALTTAASSRATAAAPAESLENLLGARWAVWAGGLALALGGVFLVRYSIESGLLGPGVRLTLAALFGLLLIAAGELVRQKALPKAEALYANAMVPGILTAAGAVSLFGAIYAAHGIYEFIGPTLAFLLLGLTAFGVLGLSLLHGQALAGLGLVGSMLTPLLISTTAPSLWTLFIYLTVAQIATALASRIKGWLIVPAIAQVLLGLWALVALIDSAEITPIALSLIAMIAAWMLIWPGVKGEDPAEPGTPLSLDALGRRMAWGPLALDITLSLAVLIPALVMLDSGPAVSLPLFAFAALVAALAAAGSARHGAFWPTVLAAVGALIGAVVKSGLIAQAQVLLLGFGWEETAVVSLGGPVMLIFLVLAAVFAFIGLAQNRRRFADEPLFATVWAVIVAVLPVTLATISFLFYGTYARDWVHGLFALGLGSVLLAACEYLYRQGALPAFRRGVDILLLGSFFAFVLALHCLTDGVVTTILLALIGFTYLMATRKRAWSGLPWVMVAALVGVLFRIFWDPTLVGPDALSRTPVFNPLLPGYGIPALLALLSAYQMRNWPGLRVRNALQGLASLLGLLAVAILVRHAMNGGVLDASAPTLGEQSIYTLLVVGLSGILMTLNVKSPSHVFRYGSMLAGGLAIAQTISLHLGALNPYFSGESSGSWPLINLLLIGYLLPGLAYAGLAFYARDKRPLPYVILLALSGALLGFAWVTLSVRRFWQGEFIAYWKGFEQAETYSYSVAWLAIGVGLLALGSRFDARSLRIASAVIVILTVAKVFLIDMANLEGVLRALSFIGLGFVLIGIGLFYQRILSGKSSRSPAVDEDEAPTGI